MVNLSGWLSSVNLEFWYGSMAFKLISRDEAGAIYIVSCRENGYTSTAESMYRCSSMGEVDGIDIYLHWRTHGKIGGVQPSS